MIFPLFAMFVLNVVVQTYGLYIRIQSIKSGEVHGNYFKVFDARKEIPIRIVQQKNNSVNLFELPVFFYIGIVLYLMKSYTNVDLILCWLFVLTRYLHSYIHITYNNTLHRLASFAVGLIILTIIYVKLLVLYA